MARPQLGALDVAFLCLERETAPMHFGALLVFGAPPSGELRSVATLLGERAGRLAALRQRAQPTWCPPGGAVWAEDPDFRIEDHLTVHHLKHSDELPAVVAEAMARPLDPAHPLWHLNVIGLADGRFAVLAKLHHAVCDGPEAVELSLGLFDGFTAPTRTSTPCSGDRPNLRTAARSASAALTRPARWIDGATKIAHLGRQIYEAAGIVSAVLGSMRLPDPGSPLAGTRSARRRVAMSRLSLSRFQQVRALHGGTVNDVILALVTGALREWLKRRNRTLHGRTVRALVPVNRRPTPSPATGRNQLSGYLCELPVGEPDPLQRLHEISSTMNSNKAAGPHRGPGAFPVIAEHLPRAVHRIVTPVIAHGAPLLCDLVVSNVPLPAIALAVQGAELHEVYPFVPLAPGHIIGIAACSYGDALCVGVNADPQAMADLADFADSLPQELDKLARHA